MENCGSRKRKALTSRHPNVEKPADEPELRRTAFTKTRTVVDHNFNIDGDVSGVDGQIDIETNVVDVKEEPSDAHLQRVEARHIDIVAANPITIHTDDLMDIMGRVTFAPADYRTATAAAIVNLNFLNIRSSNFVHFFLTCIPRGIRHLRLEGNLNFPIAVTHQLKILLLNRLLENLVIRNCVRIDDQLVVPPNILDIIISNYSEFGHIVLLGERGLDQEAVWNFILSLVQNENPLKFRSAAISFEGSHEEMAARIAHIRENFEPVIARPKPSWADKPRKGGLQKAENPRAVLRNRHGIVRIGLTMNYIQIKCD
ncbi:hypothetical protein QR680_018503 [Steinernema hermaphroditum]|uniref:Uncharacterized protein n=1 Tax=Steinernema hermaphroditum TaxID=289476 RepID=A0AA39LQV1_9BILA|nr:hypothetical protein QR680_018503 [Steinernema hermaphroditum]